MHSQLWSAGRRWWVRKLAMSWTNRTVRFTLCSFCVTKRFNLKLCQCCCWSTGHIQRRNIDQTEQLGQSHGRDPEQPSGFACFMLKEKQIWSFVLNVHEPNLNALLDTDASWRKSFWYIRLFIFKIKSPSIVGIYWFYFIFMTVHIVGRHSRNQNYEHVESDSLK